MARRMTTATTSCRDPVHIHDFKATVICASPEQDFFCDVFSAQNESRRCDSKEFEPFSKRVAYPAISLRTKTQPRQQAQRFFQFSRRRDEIQRLSKRWRSHCPGLFHGRRHRCRLQRLLPHMSVDNFRPAIHRLSIDATRSARKATAFPNCKIGFRLSGRP